MSIPTTIAVPSFVIHSAQKATHYSRCLLHLVEKIPGSHYVIDYIKRSHKNDPYRSLFELALLLFALYYFQSSRYEPSKDKLELKSREVDDLISEWEPEPLTVAIHEQEEWRLQSVPVVTTAMEPRTDVTLLGKKFSQVLNMSSLNFLNFSHNSQILQAAKEVVHNYGVGACGPPGFYGNQDMHIHAEQDLAKYFGTENCVLYGQDFCTAQSVIPAFVKRGDFIVADSAVNMSVQKALYISRATIIYYKHNDMDDLQKVLDELAPEFVGEKPITRKFIVTEGVFANSGDIAPLPKLVELKRRYKFRLLVDESLSLGVLGATGRGLAEHFGMTASDIDLVVGSMATAFGSSGGFVLGSHATSVHQRIGSAAYCFSASLPPYTARAVSTGLAILERSIVNGKSTLVSKLHQNCKTLYDCLIKGPLKVLSNPASPMVLLQLPQDVRTRLGFPEDYCSEHGELAHLQKQVISDKFVADYELENKMLQQIVNEVLVSGKVLITRHSFVLHHEANGLLPSLKVCNNIGFSTEELQSAADCINTVAARVLRLSTSELESL